ncbi:growth hormone-regulated TBC protein 1 isoform X3 [Panthera pardus]|uniref:Growth hormone-regulated TBC protein 1 isoform X3 n=1 Tax=Panthera pardus TaxID=9691 RepID=A0A9W2W1D4_PANPR|nr:growth hormone-regulated TBC protein 1 isoform X3 [Panthera pardus]
MEPAGRPRDRVPRIDPYGFERPEDFDYAAYEEFFSAYLVILTRRAMKWSKLLKGGGGVQKSGTVKRYIRKGVPLEHRAHVWMGVSGAQARMDQNPGYYHRLLQGECCGRLEEAIRTDMNRTFPDNVKFRKSADPCLQKILYNVLVAYGRHNQGVGYCQGMNFIAGYLVLITKSEEKSFWLLDALVGRILPENIFRARELVHGHHHQASRELQGQAAGAGLTRAPVCCRPRGFISRADVSCCLVPEYLTSVHFVVNVFQDRFKIMSSVTQLWATKSWISRNVFLLEILTYKM